MSKYKVFILFALQCSLILFSLQHQNRPQHVHSQTIPSPTPDIPPTDTPIPPTPIPPTDTPIPIPTSTPDGNGGGDSTPTSGSTPTTQAAATATLVPASTLAPTPQGGYLPTAAPCDDAPTIQAFNNLNVRQGSGTDYEIINRVVFLEVRPIIGRSQYDRWWLIELADGTIGWVADATGLSQGYIGNVPIIPAPPINNQTPTPGTPWQPTPRPSCTVTPTPTTTATATASTTPQPTFTATTISEATPTFTPSPTIAGTATLDTTNNEADAATRIADAANLSVVEQDPTATQAPTAYPIQPTTTPLEEDIPDSTPNFLPVIGLILIAGGIFAAIARRQFSKQ